MHMLVTTLIVGVLWLCPFIIEAGTPGTMGEQRPEQKQIISTDNLKLVQQRLTAEGVYAGPVDGELNAQTEAALRQYQAKQGLPVSGAVDEATLQQLQITLPTSPAGKEK
jgi:peptidoglycan hydrolase-like protein with peptidoglycan-binding domain